MSITKSEIEELEQQLIEGIKTSNIPFLDGVLHDDLLFLAPKGEIITKAMDLASHRAGDMVVEQIVPNIEDISVVDDTAVVIITYHTKGMMLGQPIEGQFRYIRIWKKFQDGIKIIGGSCIKL